MTKLDTTRRALLKAGPIAAVAITIPVNAATALSSDRSEWDTALAAYRAAVGEETAFNLVYDEACKKCRAETDRVPHVALGPSAHDGRAEVTTADSWYVKRCRSDVKALDEGRMRFEPWPELQEHESQMRELIAADDERLAAIAAIRARYNKDALDDRSDALGDLVSKTQGAVMDTPAPDMAALRWKLDHITEEAINEDGSLPCYSSSYVRQMIADIARLLPKGA